MNEEVQTPVDPRAFLIPFIKELRTLIPKSDLERYLWISKAGLFVKDEFAPSLEVIFKKWFFDQHQVTLDDEKVTRKLFLDEHPIEKYLLTGSSVVVGFVCPSQTSEVRGVGIRLYEGIPLDTATTLHHTDSIFFQSEALSIHLTKKGYVISIKTKRKEFCLDVESVAKLRSFFKATGEQRKHINSSTLRLFVNTLAKSLEFAKGVPSNQMMLLPVRFTSGFKGQMYQVGSVIFIESGDKENLRLSDCFGVEGRGYEHLVREELLLLAEAFGRRRIAGASLSVTKGSFLAHYDILGIHHSFGVNAVFSFLKAIDEYYKVVGKLPGRLKGKATIQDIIPEITGLLRDASPILLDKIPGRLKEEYQQIGTVLSARGEWFVAVDRAKMVREISFVPKQVKAPIQIKEISRP